MLGVVGEPLDFCVMAVKGKNRLGRRSLCLVCKSLITKAFSKCKENFFTNQIVH